MIINDSIKTAWQACVAGLEAQGHPVNPERGAFEVDTDLFGSDFVRTLEGDEGFARSIRTVRHDFWLECGPKSHRLVALASESSREFFSQWKAVSRRVWGTIESIDALIVASSDFTNADRRAKLKMHLVALQEHERSIKPMMYEMRRDNRTPLSSLVGSFAAKLNNVIMPYDSLYQLFDDDEFFRETVEDIRSAPFKSLDLCGRISGSLNKSCSHSPAFSVELGAVPTEGVIPASKCVAAAHALFDRVALMGAMLASQREQRSVELRYSCAEYEQSGATKWANILIDNPDGRFTSHLARLMQQPHLFPAWWCEIPMLAVQVAPEGFRMQLVGTQMHIPLRVR